MLGPAAILGLKEALKRVNEARNTVVLGHVNADGDVIGSIYAFYHRFSPRSESLLPIFFEPIPDRYAFLGRKMPYAVFDPQDAGQLDTVLKADLIVVLDLATEDRIPGWSEIFPRFKGDLVCIDHHPRSPGSLGQIQVIEPTACATGEILFELFKVDGRDFSQEEALGLFTAITTDTGWFRYTNTKPEVLAMAAELLGRGIEPSEVYGAVYQVKEFNHIRLLGKLVGSTRSRNNNELLWVTVPRALLDEFGITELETEDLLDALRSVKECRCVALFRESTNGDIRVNLRSKGGIEINKFAELYGGGGHRKAAGMTVRGMSLDEAADSVVDAIVAFMSGEKRPDG